MATLERRVKKLEDGAAFDEFGRDSVLVTELGSLFGIPTEQVPAEYPRQRSGATCWRCLPQIRNRAAGS